MPMALSLTHPHSGEHKLIDRLLAIDRRDAVANVFDSVAHIDSTPMLFQVCVGIRELRKRLSSGALSHCRDRNQGQTTQSTVRIHPSCCTALTSAAWAKHRSRSTTPERKRTERSSQMSMCTLNQIHRSRTSAGAFELRAEFSSA